MRIQVLSDLHLEHRGYVPRIEGDVVVLAGDIGASHLGLVFAAHLPVPVVYVMGNHEYYGADLSLLRELKEKAANPRFKAGHVHILENEAVEIDGVEFAGATLWTDFKLHGQQPVSMVDAQMKMADYKAIAGLSPIDTVEAHYPSRRFLEDHHQIIVTHHAPCPRSLHPRFEGDSLNPAFASDIPIWGRVWIHGHTHYACDYEERGVRVVCNPRGYPGEGTGFEDVKIIEYTP